jgi:hypothetical protein
MLVYVCDRLQVYGESIDPAWQPALGYELTSPAYAAALYIGRRSLARATPKLGKLVEDDDRASWRLLRLFALATCKECLPRTSRCMIKFYERFRIRDGGDEGGMLMGVRPKRQQGDDPSRLYPGSRTERRFHYQPSQPSLLHSHSEASPRTAYYTCSCRTMSDGTAIGHWDGLRSVEGDADFRLEVSRDG